MAYTNIDDPSAYFQVKLWTGTGSTQSLTFDGNSDMQPDLVWAKTRNDTQDFQVIDSVRGATKLLATNGNAAEFTDTNNLTSFNSDGFTIGSSGGINGSSDTLVAWCWKASGSSGSGTTAGSGTSKAYSYILNTTAGFSITKFVGNGTSGHKIPHSLGATPKMFVVKNRSTGSTDWQVYSPIPDPTDALAFNQHDPTGDSESYWSDEAPDATHIVVGGGNAVNKDGDDLVCYAWKEVTGYSKFHSYIGNGNASGPMIVTGFKPAMVIIKSSTEVRNWRMFDNKRSPYNLTDEVLYTDLSNAEATGDSEIDMLSNGFKLRKTSDNTSGETYIYMAFAEAPFVTSTGIPTTAR